MNTKENLVVKIAHCEKIKYDLMYSYRWLSGERIDSEWIERLDDDKKERLTAFVARFGRMQDYFSDKLLKAWLDAAGENSERTVLENYGVAEKVGILSTSSENIIGSRKLRNELTHDYIENATVLADKLNQALDFSIIYCETFDRLKVHSFSHLHIEFTG